MDQYERGFNDAIISYYSDLNKRIDMEREKSMESVDELIDKIWEYKSNMVVNGVSYICKSDIVDVINEHFGKET